MNKKLGITILIIVLFSSILFIATKNKEEKIDVITQNSKSEQLSEAQPEDKLQNSILKTYASSDLGISLTYPEKIDFDFGFRESYGTASIYFRFEEVGNKLFVIGDIKEKGKKVALDKGGKYFVEFFVKEKNESFEKAIQDRFIKNIPICFVQKISETRYHLSLTPEESSKYEIEGDCPSFPSGYGYGYFVTLNENRYMFIQSSGQEPYFGLGEAMKFWPPVPNKNLTLFQ